MNDDRDKEMEAQQCKEQQHRQVIVSTASMYPQRYKTTVRGGGPFLDSIGVCAVLVQVAAPQVALPGKAVHA